MHIMFLSKTQQSTIHMHSKETITKKRFDQNAVLPKN